ncbi:MAG: GNAT family N-acetyltransferase [Gammaproteobacteria bacterium]|nr:GNAT family N-acetyltransferase [Gammaproteobacteria bacterium]
MEFAHFSSLQQLPESCDSLFALAEKDSLFYSRPWFDNLTATLAEDQVLLLACVMNGNKALAMLPLIKSTADQVSSLKHRYTTHFSLLLAESKNEPYQQQIILCLIQGLSQLRVRSLLLEPVAADDNNIRQFKQALENNGYGCEYHFRSYNWIYRLQGQSHHDYLASRSARLRNTISRKQRKLEREHGYDIRLFTGDEVRYGMTDYYAVYAASWKANEQYVDFFNGMAGALSKRGWSRLAVLYVNDKPVAAQLWFVVHGKASIFRLAYDEAWKQYSPGTILTNFLMNYVIDIDKVKEIDFLTGNDAYKQDWMSQRRQRFALSCVNNKKASGRLKQFISAVKHVIKRR